MFGGVLNIFNQVNLNGIRKEIVMTMDKVIKIMAGTFILISVALAVLVSKWWLVWTVLVGLNLIQSAFTNWCPASGILAKFGIQGSCSIKK
jgi:hypothetical protein